VEDQSAVEAFLADPATHGGRPVERVDTHGSMVFLAGRRAYKVKRAVRFPYMDYGTLARRRAMCQAEVRLNRRTAPGLYLGVAAIHPTPGGALALGPVGAQPEEAIEWVVVMRRFDEATLFDRLAQAGRLTTALMLTLAVEVAAFHRAAEPCRGGGAAVMRATAAESLAELADAPEIFDPARVERLRRESRRALRRVGGLLDRRAAEGRVRQCHGDLHLRNICLVRGRPTLFDGIEFNEDFSVIDVLYDLAFLLMDLDHRGLRPFANRVLNRYLQVTGDIDGLAALPIFLATRAAVRAKVGASNAALQVDPARQAALQEEARAYLDGALAYLEPAAARLIAVGGLSGSGKTTLAFGLAPSLGPPPGAIVLRSDVIRKQLAGTAETARLPPEAYRPEVGARVYGELGRRAAGVLAAGYTAIADAVFGTADQRAAIAAVARRAEVPFTGLWLDAGPATLLRRVSSRAGDASDADVAVVGRQLQAVRTPIDWPSIDADGRAERTLRLAREAVHDAGASRAPARR
jgi:aminoglycoside phosphotransferase family enzyme/predicted kinase